MSVLQQDSQRFIEIQALDRWLQVLEGNVHELNVDGIIRTDAAMQALHSGFSLIDIVRKAVWQFEKSLIEQVLVFTNGNRSHASRLLKIDCKTLYRHLHKYRLAEEGWDGGRE